MFLRNIKSLLTLYIDFIGYVDRIASEKRIARDVLAHGDAFYLTGDLVVCDELGYVFFNDRIGDTYRWRSENVSTTEVESYLSKLLDMTDVVVYGVEVPGHDGRAGMAAIVGKAIDEQVLNEIIFKGLRNNLPNYAWPVFIRIVKSIQLTASLKFVKTDLKSDGFDPIKTKSDTVYVLTSTSKVQTLHYAKMNSAIYEDITNGCVKL